jgi:hypothetical protein
MKFRVADDGSLMMGQRLYVPNDETVKWMVLQEAHESKLSIHPGSTKMYRDLKHLNWWPNMKREIAEYVSKCEICQQVKVEHQRPTGPLQPLQIINLNLSKWCLKRIAEFKIMVDCKNWCIYMYYKLFIPSTWRNYKC